MSPRTQAKVLRALEESRIVRVGGSRPVEVDVRILSATNQDLRGSGFRSDLLHRLEVIPIEMPPLAGPPRGHPAARRPLPRNARKEGGPARAPVHPRRARGSRRPPVPGQCAGVAKPRGAPADPEFEETRSASPMCASSSAAPRGRRRIPAGVSRTTWPGRSGSSCSSGSPPSPATARGPPAASASGPANSPESSAQRRARTGRIRRGSSRSDGRRLLRAGGKSELHKAVRWVTPSPGNRKESATENRPPLPPGSG